MDGDPRRNIAQLEREKEIAERAEKGTKATFRDRKEGLYERIRQRVSVRQLDVFIVTIVVLIILSVIFGIWIGDG